MLTIVNCASALKSDIEENMVVLAYMLGKYGDFTSKEVYDSLSESAHNEIRAYLTRVANTEKAIKDSTTYMIDKLTKIFDALNIEI